MPSRPIGSVDRHIDTATVRGTIYLLRDQALVGEDIDRHLFQDRFQKLLYWRDHRLAEMEAVCECSASAHSFGRGSRPARAPGAWSAQFGTRLSAERPDRWRRRARGAIDIDANIVRELGEETGLVPRSLCGCPVTSYAIAGGRSRSAWNGAVALSPRSCGAHARFIEAESEPELDDIVIVRRAPTSTSARCRTCPGVAAFPCQLDRPR